MELEISGNIRKLDYDHIQDMERIEFRDEDKDYELYIEVPRLDRKVSFQKQDEIHVLLTDDLEYEFDPASTKVVFNTTLYMVRREEGEGRNIIQFSAGGLIFRIITSQDSPFRLRGNRAFKIVAW